MKKFTNALSNDVEIKGKKVIKKYKKDEFKEIYGNAEIILLEKMGYKYKGDQDKVEIEYFQHKPFIDEKITDQDILNVVKAIKKINSLSKTKLRISPFKEVYLGLLTKLDGKVIGEEEMKIATRALKILESGKQVVLHNDLVSGNLLKVNDNEIKLIDFEYSGLGNQLFDIASFITERDLNEEQEKLFISKFTSVNKKNLMIVSAFLQIFWARWALFKYTKTKKVIYKEIAKWKQLKYYELVEIIDFKKINNNNDEEENKKENSKKIPV
ncbi:MAG: hypothetical protein TYPL_3740 [Candidatus Tyloplasma litorale]|nr:MAG: hypothetical protein TYPL_3740 [Mycoplasmatales bacterium]